MITANPSTTVRASAMRRVRPLSDIRALMLESLHGRWRALRAELKRCRKRYSEEAVHDLRVATRRLISTLELVDRIHPEGNLRKARRTLKKQLDLFGPLRDVQVQLLTIEKMLPSFPELQEFFRVLEKRERRLKQRLRLELKRLKTGKIRKGIVTAARQLATLPDTPAVQRKHRAEAILAIETAFDRVVERKQAITPTDGASIHRMRVAFKKFRYMVEALGPLRGHTTNKQLKAMNAFQGSMGEIQDAEVLLANVQDFARSRGTEGELAFARALEELSRRRLALIETFLGSADTVFTFWKSVPKTTGMR
jgi:CHAD domain-containing protein